MPHSREHQEEVRHYLQKCFRIQDWNLSLPRGSGMETYFAKGNGQEYFVKVGAPVERYLAVAEIGLTPPVIAYGRMDSGLSILIQPFIDGRKPTRLDYRNRLYEVAEIIRKTHHSRITGTPQTVSSSLHKDAGVQALELLCQKWVHYKTQVPHVADFVDESLHTLAGQVSRFTGEGLVTAHGDICNANWLFTSDGRIYILDFESMSIDDPAADLGALLWWYYPPELRQQFLTIAEYPYDEEFRFRMQVRMALHCLSITLPRESSFDAFDPEVFSESLRDFRAVLNGAENPEGYAT
jgi:thiamine kinase-like enzyme